MAKKIKDSSKNYSAIIKVLGKTYKSEGLTIQEAIENLKLSNCKGRGILTIDNGEISKDRVLMPTVVYRLFNTVGMSRDIAIKNVSLLFQGL